MFVSICGFVQYHYPILDCSTFLGFLQTQCLKQEGLVENVAYATKINTAAM
jgi:hypothetical protein